MLRWTTISSPRASRVALHQVANVQVPFIFKWTIDLLNESEAAVDVAANATILGLTSAGTLLIGCESPALTAHVRDGCRQRSLPRPPARGLATRCSVGTLAKATLLLLALAWASSSASDPCDSAPAQPRSRDSYALLTAWHLAGRRWHREDRGVAVQRATVRGVRKGRTALHPQHLAPHLRSHHEPGPELPPVEADRRNVAGHRPRNPGNQLPAFVHRLQRGPDDPGGLHGLSHPGT